MIDEYSFYRNVLENMNDGVMTLDMKGSIIMFNPAAETILGQAADRVLEKPFGQVFMMEMEGNDDFNQVILDAVYEDRVGETTRVDFRRPEGDVVNLVVTATYLSPRDPDGGENEGVILVFSDITDMQKLQAAEKELHLKLREAYLEVEETNRHLKGLLKRVQVVRVTATLLVILLFLGAGLYSWDRELFQKKTWSGAAATEQAGEMQRSVLTIAPREISTNVSLSGTIMPLEEVNVVAPFSGKILKAAFDYGQPVAKGAVLLHMDTGDLAVKLRDAKTAHIQARQKYSEVVDWKKSNEVSRARRSHTKAQNSLEASRRKLEETNLLYEKGIVPAQELDASRSDYENQKLDFAAVEEELASVLQKGSPENVNIARFALENARIRVQELEEQLHRAVVHAPVTGIAILPLDKQDKEKQRIGNGVSVNQGDILLSVANLEGLSVTALVDEIDINRVKAGQPVIVSGDAFTDLQLSGKIGHIASNARKGGHSGVPMFDVIVIIDDLTAEQRRKIRLGMSANLQVQVYHNPEALLVPIELVRTVEGRHWLTVQDPSSETVKDVEVQTGTTTLNEVEIVGGLHAGDRVVMEFGSGSVRGPEPDMEHGANEVFGLPNN